MSSLPARAKVVIIGAGIVGNSIAYHLARLGWRDIVLLDKGTLPNPGGSTGHASNFIFPTDHSKEMTALTLDSVRQYKELGVFTQSGGIEVARTPERMEELKRRMASSQVVGHRAPSSSRPAEVKELVPYHRRDGHPRRLLHARASASSTRCEAGTIMRERAQEMGALTISPATEVTGLDVEDGRITARPHRQGRHRGRDRRHRAAACWSPRIARDGRRVDPADAGGPPDDQRRARPAVRRARSARSTFPIVRDMDTNMYERQHGGDLEVGSYAHRPILMEPDDIPSIEASALSPTELPFTQEDFELQMEQALELVPDILGDERVGIRYAINGLLSLTPDGDADPGRDARGQGPLVGGRGLDQGGARHRPRGRRVDDPRLARDRPPRLRHRPLLRPPQDARPHRGAQRRGLQQDLRHRPPDGAMGSRTATSASARATPAQKELGAVFFEAAGWERPFWYGANETLLAEYGDRVMPRTAEWESRWWSPIINAEHLAMRDRVAMVDLAAFAIFDVTGPGALDYLQGLVVSQMDVPVGRVVYTPLLAANGGIVADLTIMRLGHDTFRVVTGGGMGMRDQKWFTDHLPADGSAQLHDATSALYTLGVWGPRARDVLASATSDDVSNAGFPFGTCRADRDRRRSGRLASRISYVGELGWEIYAPDGAGPPAVGHALGGRPAVRRRRRPGSACTRTTGRLEKGYRAHGNELELEYDLVEAGMARPKVKDARLHRQGGVPAQREAPPAAILCTLTVDDPTSSTGVKRYMIGQRADPDAATASRSSTPRAAARTSRAPAPARRSASILLMSYLPPEQAVVGTPAARRSTSASATR